MKNEDKYLPYTKKDFRKYWCDPESNFPEMQTFEVIRPLPKKRNPIGLREKTMIIMKKCI